jgi:hypothetical protein
MLPVIYAHGTVVGASPVECRVPVALGVNEEKIDLTILVKNCKRGARPAQLRGKPQIDCDPAGGELDALGWQLGRNATQGLDRGQRQGAAEQVPPRDLGHATPFSLC